MSPDPLHVTFVTGSYRPDQDGVADYLANLRSHLAQYAITSTILTTYDSAEAIADDTVKGALSHWSLPQLLPLVRRIRATPTDLLHIQHAAGSYRFERSIFLLPLLLRLSGYSRPIVTTAHEYGWWDWQPNWIPKPWLEGVKEWGQARGWWDREDGFLLTGSDAVITTNENITRTMVERLGENHSHLTTIPIAANLTVIPIAQPTARQELRQHCGWSADTQVITFFGFLHPVKGIEPLIHGFQQVTPRHPQARLLLMGGVETLALQGKEAEDYWQKIQALIRELELGDRIHCTGYIPAETASCYLSGSDMGVLPFNPGVSLKSGSLLAMLAHRLPTIATHTEESDVVLLEKQAIAPIPPRNSEALAEAIHHLLKHPEEGDRLATNGYNFAQSFTWESIARQHYNIYQQVNS